MRIQRAIAAIVGLGLPFFAACAQAADLKVFSSTALKTVLDELGPQFEKSTESKLVFNVAAAAALKGLKVPGDEQIGVDTIRRACEEPIRQIVLNSGEEGAIVIGKIRENSNPHFGYNAQTDQHEDLVASGVIDPAMVTRSALQNAASIAGLMLTTEAMVCEIPEKKSAPAGPGGHGGPEGMDY